MQVNDAFFSEKPTIQEKINYISSFTTWYYFSILRSKRYSACASIRTKDAKRTKIHYNGIDLKWCHGSFLSEKVYITIQIAVKKYDFLV